MSKTRQIVSWCLFDFANSSYTTLIITVAYAVYFRDVVVGAQGNRGDELWGIANFMAMASVALASPIVGAFADFSGRKKFFLIGSTLMTVIATALMYFIGPGDIAKGMALFVIGTFGFEIGYVFYNAFLADISTPETVGRVSGWGWGDRLCRWPALSASVPTTDPAGLQDRRGNLRLSFVLPHRRGLLPDLRAAVVFLPPRIRAAREALQRRAVLDSRLQAYSRDATPPAPLQRNGQIHPRLALLHRRHHHHHRIQPPFTPQRR